jgi:hypothetical protein
MKKKFLVGLATGMFLAGIVGVANAAIITFDDAISGSTSYEFDGDGDLINDVIFSTTDPYGFNTVGPGSNMTYIEEPGLEGTSLLVEDLRVDFTHGAVDGLAFGFALDSTTEDDTATINVFNSFGELIGSETITGAFTTTPSGSSNFPEGYVEVSFEGKASYATFDFTSDYGRFIIDNFSGLFGSTEVLSKVTGQITIDTTPGHEDRDHARFKMTNMVGLAAAATEHDPVDVYFSIENGDGEIVYEFPTDGEQGNITGGNTLRFMTDDGDKRVTCRLAQELCVIFIERYTDLNEDALYDDVPLTLTLEINGTEFSHTASWSEAAYPERAVYTPSIDTP